MKLRVILSQAINVVVLRLHENLLRYIAPPLMQLRTSFCLVLTATSLPFLMIILRHIAFIGRTYMPRPYVELFCHRSIRKCFTIV